MGNLRCPSRGSQAAIRPPQGAAFLSEKLPANNGCATERRTIRREGLVIWVPPAPAELMDAIAATLAQAGAVVMGT